MNMPCPNRSAHPVDPKLMDGPEFTHDYGLLIDLWTCDECLTEVRIFDPYRKTSRKLRA